MVDATTIYKEAALMSGMDNRNLAVFTDYFFSTFMQHYKLYQYVYSFERDLARHVTHVSVEAPVPPEELRNAKTPSLHEYDQQIKEIQKNRAEVKELQPLSSVEVQLDEDLTTCAQTEVKCLEMFAACILIWYNSIMVHSSNKNFYCMLLIITLTCFYVP